MILFYKLLNGLTPKYLFDIIPVSNDSCYNTRVQRKANLSNSLPEQEASATLSFPSVLKNGTSWMIKSEIYHPFLIQKIVFNLFKDGWKFNFDVHDPIGIMLLNRLRLNFSHLNEHKCRHNFRDTINPFCLCNAETETTCNYILRCPLFSEQRTKLLESLSNLDNTLLNHYDDSIKRFIMWII